MEFHALVDQVTERVFQLLQQEQAASSPAEIRPERAPYFIERKAVTEREISRAYEEGFTAIRIKQSSILTDAAKDYANDKHITLIRE
ncbi:hypothetical protein V6615_13725 [Oscillospiraceae bacterium PP1C4]